MISKFRLCFPLFLFLLCAGNLVSAQDRIAGTIDRTRSVRLRGRSAPSVLPRTDPGADLGPVDPTLALDDLTLLLNPGPGLEGFLASQQTPGSPQYHQWLTPEQFADHFGASTGDIAKLTTWLRAEGFRVKDVARGRHWISFSGNAKQAAAAFHTQLHHYRVNGAVHFASSTEPQVPAALAGIAAGFLGLDDFLPTPFYTEKLTADPLFNSGSSHYLAPGDIATIYNLTPLYAAGIDGTGQRIAVIGRTDIVLSDIRAFRARFNLPPSDPEVVLFGPDPGISSGDLPEAHLDIEWTGAVAPKATIVYVNSRSVITSAQYAIDQNLAPVMTMSYGSCELLSNPALRSVAQQGSAQGITWMISSGDSGAAACDSRAPTAQASKGKTVSFPASIPEVTAVGGTQFDEGNGNYWGSSNGTGGGSALSYIPEAVWNGSAEHLLVNGGGGGPSALFSKPLWQTGPGVPADGVRDLPDVSFSSASSHDGYEVYTSGAIHIYGGTSVASPVFAGIVSLLNQAQVKTGLGNINPALYRLAQSSSGIFHDIIKGDNAVPCSQGSPDCVNGLVGFNAVPGYDLATGLGSLDAFKLVNGWTSGGSTTTTLLSSILRDSVTGASADEVLLNVAVASATGTPTGTVTFVSSDLVLGTSTLSGAGTAILSINGASAYSGDGTIRSLYSGDGNFTGSAGSTAVSPNPPVAGSLVIASVNPNPVAQTLSGWPYTVQLREKAGVATKLTSFTVNGAAQNLSFWTSTSLTANGTISATLLGNLTVVPANRIFVFSGVDDSGATWTQQITVPFIGTPSLPTGPGLSLSVYPSSVQKDPNADASCQWQQDLVVHETGGFAAQLSSLASGTTTLSTKISSLFGTNRLAPFGTLHATLCWAGTTATGSRSYSVVATSEAGGTVSGTATATLLAAPASAAAFGASPAAVTFNGNGGATAVELQFINGSPKWTATVVSVGRNATWLSVSPLTGTGSAQLTLSAAPETLSNGAYSALIQVQAVDSAPQLITIPVTLTVGNNPQISVGGLTNGASYKSVFAPGMIMSVFGTGLAPLYDVNTRLPLPLKMDGVTAAVNGISAPLYFNSTGQMNVQIPYEAGAGPAVLAVNNNGVVSSFNFQINPTAPGIFAATDLTLVPYGTGKQGDILLAFITGEGDVSPGQVTGSAPSASTPIPQLPVPRLPLTLTVGGVPAEILFGGIPPFLVGVTQVNFKVPLTVEPGPQPVVVTVGGVASPPVTLLVTAAP